MLHCNAFTIVVSVATMHTTSSTDDAEMEVTESTRFAPPSPVDARDSDIFLYEDEAEAADEAKPERAFRADSKATTALRQQRAAVCAVVEQFLHPDDARAQPRAVEWHADANFCRAPSFMLDRMQDPDNFEDFRHAGMIGPVECLRS